MPPPRETGNGRPRTSAYKGSAQRRSAPSSDGARKSSATRKAGAAASQRSGAAAPRKSGKPSKSSGPTQASARAKEKRAAALRKRNRSQSPRRLIGVFVCFTLLFAAMTGRLVLLQIFEGPAYAQRAAAQRERVIEFPARRGAIFDRDGEPLAISIDLQTVWTDPTFVEDAYTTAVKLAPLVKKDPFELEERLLGVTPGDRFEYLARQVEPKVVRKIKALDLPGIYFESEPKLYYPGSRLASHLLGFVDVDGKGISGLEAQFEGVLKGRAGKETLEQDLGGRSLPQAEYTHTQAKPGQSLFLTIDKELQYFTQLKLAQAAQQFGAEAGTAIVMRPRNGEILALANYPDFDPNNASEFPADALKNRAITDVYEPGSIYKIVTASAALEDRIVTPRTNFGVPDSFPYAGEVFNDSHAHAAETMSVKEIIQDSSNVGTIKIGLMLGGERLDHYVRKFGFGTRTGLNFPGETSGIVIDRKDWSGATIATIPIGQGVAVTPIQMAAAYSTVANDGVWVQPRLVSGTMNNHGAMERPQESKTRQVISRRTSRQMSKILTSVVDEGTGEEAQIPGYLVAGKTGTAQKPLPSGGYGNSYVASFAGFAPADDPEVVVLVVLDEPTPIWGGLTAAPTFRLITEFALRHLGVPPSGNAEKAAAEIEASQLEVAYD